MKKIGLFLFLMVAMVATSMAQAAKASPAMTATGKIGASNVTVSYSSPSVKGRAIWGALVPYNEIWRAGANNASTVTFDKAVTIDGKSVAAGTYAFFAIPTKDKWTLILNTDAKQWGAYDYKKEKDVARVDVKPSKTSALVEKLTYKVVATGVALSWENVEVVLPIK